MFRRIIVSLGLTVFSLSLAVAEPEAPAQGQSALNSLFWSGIEALHVLFKGFGSLAGGPDRGVIWQFDISTRTHTRISAGDGLAWPVLGPDNRTVFALKGNQPVQIRPPEQQETDFGPDAAWRKFVGVAPDGTVLGLVERSELVRPALLTVDGRLSILPEPSTGEEKDRIAALLKEDRSYAQGLLEVSRSRRGGRGFDVYYTIGQQTLNVSDCGDDACGQPSLSQDGQHVLYVRHERNRS
jgi:hypothetical protein